jgi:hypothetical protein
MSVEPIYLVAAVVVGLVLGVAVLWGWPRYRDRRRRAAREARMRAASVDYVRNVLVPDGSDTGLHVDYLLLTPQGLLILDLREVKGHVFGSDTMIEWAVIDGARRVAFGNPQAAMYDRLAAIKALVPDIPVEGRIVFSAAAIFPRGLPPMVWRESDIDPERLLGERRHAEERVAPWREAWSRLTAVLKPSQFTAAES